MSVSRALGRAANSRGKFNELSVLHELSLASEEIPWLVSVREATAEEDKRGIDIVVQTDVGKIFVQVKSSKRGVEKFTRKKSKSMIAVVLASHRLAQAELRKRSLKSVSHIREQILSFRK